jgi:regulator of replication initiation timing
MATLISQISAIRLKVNALIQENHKLKEELTVKESRLSELQLDNNTLADSLSNHEERIVALKTANAMLGSSDYKTKTKLKINALVKEIDQCIAQLT